MNARGLLLGCAALVASACASGSGGTPALPSGTPSTEVSVEVMRGVVDPGNGAVPAPPVHVVVNVTSLLTSDERASSTTPEAQLALVETAAPALDSWLNEPGHVTLHAFDTLGKAEKSSCGGKTHKWAADALAELHADFEKRGETPDARVLLVGDLEGECAADLCKAGKQLSDRGSWLDVVMLGSAPIPDCLASLRPTDAPSSVMKVLTPAPPAFRIEMIEGNGAAPGSQLGAGIAGEKPLRVRSGLVRVVVDVNPVETIGPLQLPPGGAVKIRLMDFPLSAPDERAWIVELRNAQ